MPAILEAEKKSYDFLKEALNVRWGLNMKINQLKAELFILCIYGIGVYYFNIIYPNNVKTTRTK